MDLRSKIQDIIDMCRMGDSRSVASILDITTYLPIASVRDIDNYSILDVAIKSKRVDLIRFLFNHDVMPAAHDKISALSLAVESDDQEVLDIVLSQFNDTDGGLCNSAFRFACRNGHIETVHKLLRKWSSFSLNEPLLEACKNSHLSTALALIAAGADGHRNPNEGFLKRLLQPSFDFESMTKVFSQLDMQPVADMLLASGVYITCDRETLSLLAACRGTSSLPVMNHMLTSWPDHTPLDVSTAINAAFQGGSVRHASWLLDHASVHGFALDAPALLQSALVWQNRDMVDLVLSRFGDKCDLDPKKHIESAVGCGSVELARRLLEMDPATANRDPGQPNCAYSCSLLSSASDEDMIRLLLDAKASAVTSGPAQGSVSVLRAACRKLKPGAARMLLDAGAGVEKDFDKKTPLDYAVSAKCTDEQEDNKTALIGMLIAAGVDTSASTGNPILHTAVQGMATANRVATVKALVSAAPALLEAHCSQGTTALMLAVCPLVRDPDVAKALVAAGADVNAKDSILNKPVLFRLFSFPGQIYRPVQEILRMLLSAGADASACDGNGKTALMDLLSNPPDDEFNDRAYSMLIVDVLKSIC